MFLTLYKAEIKYWLLQPAFYIYAAVFFLIGLGLMAGYAGLFNASPATIGGELWVNSEYGIYDIFRLLTPFYLFLIPAVVGVGAHRDFKSNAFPLLFSFPLSKGSYLGAKLLSGLSLVLIIMLMLGLGIFLGCRLPGVVPERVGPFLPMAWFKVYTVYVLPHLWMTGVLIFGVVIFSRNVYAGFIALVLLLIVREGIGTGIVGMDHRWLAGILEPFGALATQYECRFWTITEKNTLSLPIRSLLIANRGVGLGLSVFMLGILYKGFNFHQLPLSFSLFKRSAASRSNDRIIDRVGSVLQFRISETPLNFSLRYRWQTTWALAWFDFKAVVTSWSFISVLLGGGLLVLVMLLQMDPQYSTKLLPVTWFLLAFPLFFFSMVINGMTFLFAGVLVNRSRRARMDQLLDSAPVRNSTQFFSHFIALVLIQIVLLSVMMVVGIFVQWIQGHTHFELDLYFTHLFLINLPGFILWGIAALFIQTLFQNTYLGIFFLVLGMMGMGLLPDIGIESEVFRFNTHPNREFLFNYSDLNGFAGALPLYFAYKFYWGLAGGLLLIGSLVAWVRGIHSTLKERLNAIKKQGNRRLGVLACVLLAGFLGMGWTLHQEKKQFQTLTPKDYSAAQLETAQTDNLHFETLSHPKVVAVEVEIDLFPEQREFQAVLVNHLVNNTAAPQDTLLISFNPEISQTYSFSKPVQKIRRDSVLHLDVFVLNSSLNPGDSLTVSFELTNLPGTFLRTNSPVDQNGTYISSHRFPAMGYYGDPFEQMPSDSIALRHHYRSANSDYITFQAVVSTSADQIAIAPGVLKKEWQEGDRKYFAYQSESPMTNDYTFQSGKYAVLRDEWAGVDLEIYYHPDHTYNLDRIMAGMKAGLAYNSANFSPYQHSVLRVIEFARTHGTFAQSFPNTIPCSETLFINDARDSTGLNYPFIGTVHEVSHQWWGHQVIPAPVQGYSMLTETMAEYVSIKVLEAHYGKEKADQFRKKSLDLYLRQRTRESDPETPLMYNSGQAQPYVPYQKGSWVMYALGEIMGPDKLSATLKEYVQAVRFQQAPYTTTPDLVDRLGAELPDSLQYLIRDYFEEVTLYENKIVDLVYSPKGSTGGNVRVEFQIEKQGIEADREYIEVGIYGKNGQELYLQAHPVNQGMYSLEIQVGETPASVSLDPRGLLLDRNPLNNRKAI